jgi:Arc/MetJ family transcription regulator
MAVFWDVVPRSLVDIDDVSNMLAASVIRAITLTVRNKILKLV